MNRKIYLCGPITGIPQNNYLQFKEAAEILRNAGYQSVINPHDLFEGIDTSGFAHHDYMKVCLKTMVDCDLLLTLDDWEKSVGATLEVKVARVLLIEVQPAFKFIQAITHSKPETSGINEH